MEAILKQLNAVLTSHGRDLRAIQSSLIEMQQASYRQQYSGGATTAPLACFSESYFSQNGEDGIITEIFRRLGLPLQRFVEIGAGDGTENNTLLRILNGGSGLWLEGSDTNYQGIVNAHQSHIASGRLHVRKEMVTAENVMTILESSGFGRDLDMLSIDIDGNDYWVWQAATVTPPVVVMEYNAFYGPDSTWVMTYNPAHYWTGGHIYYGASLGALTKLGKAKGYTLVGCDFMGVNAFFVRDDLMDSEIFPGPHEPLAMFHPFRGTLGKCRKGKKVKFGPYENI